MEEFFFPERGGTFNEDLIPQRESPKRGGPLFSSSNEEFLPQGHAQGPFLQTRGERTWGSHQSCTTYVRTSPHFKERVSPEGYLFALSHNDPHREDVISQQTQGCISSPPLMRAGGPAPVPTVWRPPASRAAINTPKYPDPMDARRRWRGRPPPAPPAKSTPPP